MQRLSSNDGEVINFQQMGRVFKIVHTVVDSTNTVLMLGKQVKLEVDDARTYYKGYKEQGYTKL